MTNKEADDIVELAIGALLIELAFLVPVGTDLTKKIGPKLLAYKKAVEDRCYWRAKNPL